MPKPRASEWGKLGEGQTFQVLALDLARALFHAGLNHYELILMQAVMEQSWYTSFRTKRHEADWPEPVACKLNISEFARSIGVKGEPEAAAKARRKRLYEAKTSLLRSHILTEDDDGLWINKNANEWTTATGQTPRLDPGSLAFALSARHRKVPGKPDISARNSGYSVPGIPDTSARKNGHECPEFRALSSAPLEPPYKVLDSQKRRRRDVVGTTSSSERAGDSVRIRGLDDAAAECERQFPGSGFAEALRADGLNTGRQLKGRFDLYTEAVKAMGSSGKRFRKPHAYALTTAKSYLDAGGAPPEPIPVTAKELPPTLSKAEERRQAKLDVWRRLEAEQAAAVSRDPNDTTETSTDAR